MAMIGSLLHALFNLLLGIILLMLAPAVVEQFFVNSADFFCHFPWYPIGAGIGIGLVAERFLRRYLPEIAIFEHEITHALAGLPFGFIPTGISISRRRGGECRQQAIFPWPLFPLYAVGQRVVTLAPYYLPVLTVFMAGFRPVTPMEWQPWYDLGLGAAFGFRSLSSFRELRENFTTAWFSDGAGPATRSDVGKTGVILSPILIVVAGLAVHGLILTVVTHGYGGIGQWGKGIGHATSMLLKVHLYPLLPSIGSLQDYFPFLQQLMPKLPG